MLPSIKVAPEKAGQGNQHEGCKDASLVVKHVPPSSSTLATAKPLALQKEEEANQPSKQQEEEKIDPSDLSFIAYDAFFVNLEGKAILPFSLQGYNIHQESITSKLINSSLTSYLLFDFFIVFCSTFCV